MVSHGKKSAELACGWRNSLPSLARLSGEDELIDVKAAFCRSFPVPGLGFSKSLANVMGRIYLIFWDKNRGENRRFRARTLEARF